MAREIGGHKLAYVYETKHFGEIKESRFFYDLEPSHCRPLESFKGMSWVITEEFAVKAFQVRFYILDPRKTNGMERMASQFFYINFF